MNELQGNVEVISTKNKACQIDGTWYSFGPNVKAQYVKKGPCEFRVEETEEGLNDNVVFIKHINGSTPSSQPQPSDKLGKALEDSNTHRMSALKFAGNVYMGTGQEEDAKRLAEEAHEYLQKGMWVTTQKA